MPSFRVPNLIFCVGRRGMKTNNPLNNDIGIWMCCASQAIQNQTQKDAKHSQMPSLHFSSHSNSHGLKPFGWEQAHDHRSSWALFLPMAAPSHLPLTSVLVAVWIFGGWNLWQSSMVSASQALSQQSYSGLPGSLMDKWEGACLNKAQVC